MKINIHTPLPIAGRQVVSAGVMLALGVAVIVGTKDYIPRTFETVPLAATPSDASEKDLTSKPDTRGANKASPISADLASPADAGQEEPSSTRLNMAGVYPDGADQEDVWDSYAGQALQLLTELDSRWISQMYESMKASPEEMAGRLGVSRNGILGLYHPSAEAHNQDDPDSWVIPDWSVSQVTFRDGDGNAISGYSNGKEIVAAASVYAFYQEDMDGESFVDICRKLWEATHQDTAQMSEVYYCDGSCQMEPAVGAENTETDAGAILPTDVTSENTSGESAATAERSSTAESSSLTGSLSAYTLPAESAESTAAESEVLPSDGSGGIPESESLPSYGISESLIESSHTDEAVSVTDETFPETSEFVDYSEIRERYSLEDVPADWKSYDGPAREVWEQVIAAYSGDLSSSDRDQATALEQEVTCPGHIDLQINAVILGMTENRNLFDAVLNGVSAVATDADGEPSGSWQGWTDSNRQDALTLLNQDWEAAYGLPVIQNLYMGTPLSPEEISYYMDMLPEDVTVFQRELIRQALQSVGSIPYYWGGKASNAGYDGNDFGAVTIPDEDGRRLRGLDCSGWINWVYWTALGKRLEFESTYGLAQLGTAIDRSQLQPGDIIVRTETETSHVYLFLAWAPNGEMYVIHETSGEINNVTVSRLHAEGPHYRRLLDGFH